MEKSLFYLCRRWLHSKAAPERIILVLKNREMISFFICPHISLSSSALGLSWLALQEEKLIFEHYCYCPIFHGEGDQNAHPWLGIWTFPYGKLKRSHVVLCLSGRMHHRGKWVGQKAEPGPSWKYCTGTETTGLEGIPQGMRYQQEGQGKVQECGEVTQLWEENQRELRATGRAARTEYRMPSFSFGRSPPTQTSLTFQWMGGWSNLQWECNSLEAGRKKDASSIWWK